MDMGCGLVGGGVASKTRTPRFEYSLWQILITADWPSLIAFDYSNSYDTKFCKQKLVLDEIQ